MQCEHIKHHTHIIQPTRRSPVISRSQFQPLTTNASFARLLAILFAASSIAFAPTPRVLAFATVAEGPLTLQTTANVTYDSYFIGNATNDPDYYFTVQPLLQYSRTSVSRLQISAGAGVSFVRYHDNTQYNANDITSLIAITLPTDPGSPFSGKFAASYNEGTAVDYDLNDRIPTRTIAGSFDLKWQLGLKTSLTDTVAYQKVMHDTDNYSDQKIWSNNLGFNYDDFLYGTTLQINYAYTKTNADGNNFNPIALDQNDNSFSFTLTRPIYGSIRGSAGVGYDIFRRGADETVSHDTQNEGLFYTLGITGPFLPPSLFPKLTSSLAIFYRYATSAGYNYSDGRTLTGDISLSWAARPRTQISVNASRSTNLNASNYTVTQNRVGMGVTETVGRSITIGANASYNWSEFKGIKRDDEFLDLALNIRYTFNDYWTLTASYEYQHNINDSSGPQPTPYAGRDYDRSLVNFAIINKF